MTKNICRDCGQLFDIPVEYKEKHGLDTPPYEIIWGCPQCGGTFVGTLKCDCCEEYITGKFIRTDDFHIYCERCYVEQDIMEDDIV